VVTNDVIYSVPEKFATDATRVQGIMDIDIAFGKDVQTSQFAPDLKKRARQRHGDPKRSYFPFVQQSLAPLRIKTSIWNKDSGLASMSLLSSLRRKCHFNQLKITCLVGRFKN
jgi:hypothetical protein